MGSSASSNVQPIHNKEGKSKTSVSGDVSRPGSSGLCRTSSITEATPTTTQVTPIQHETTQEVGDGESMVGETQSGQGKEENNNIHKQAKETILALEKQVSEAESQRLDFEEQLAGLQEQLESLHTANLLRSQGEDFSQTVQAKDQYIAALKDEATKHQAEIAKLKSKCKKKLRQVNSQLEEAKHTFSLQVFELKDEITRLTEENTALEEEMKNLQAAQAEESTSDLPDRPPTSTGERPPTSTGNRPPTSMGGRPPTSMGGRDEGQTNLILELSSRISEQDVRLVQLENQLREKDRIISDLKKQENQEVKSHRSGPSLKAKGPAYGPAENWDDDLVKYSDSTSTTVISSHKQDKHSRTKHSSHKPRSKSPGSILSPRSPRGHKSPRSSQGAKLSLYPDSTQDDTFGANADMNSEMKAIAEEMKKLRKKKKKKDSTSAKHKDKELDYRESSGVSRDSGVISMETDVDYKRKPTERVASATSTISAMSDDDNDLDLNDKTPSAVINSGRIGSASSRLSAFSELSFDADSLDGTDENKNTLKELDPASIRTISAPKRHRKKEQSEYDYIDSLLKSCDEDISKLSSRSNPSVIGKPPIPMKSSARSPFSSFEK